jgi:hypothetical protein
MTARYVVPGISALCVIALLPMTAAAQAPAPGRGNPNPLRTVTRTIYTPRTEFFAVYRPYVVGQDGRFSAHLTHITDRFEAYPVGTTVTLHLTAGGQTIDKTAMAERSGVFYFLFTPTAPGTGTAVVTLTTPDGMERFEAPVTIEPDVQAAVAHQAPAPSNEGIVRYSKEDGWDGRFATAPVAKVALGPGKAATIAVPKNAVVENNGQPYLYVQRDPEAFYFRPVKTGEGNDKYVAITDGVREGDRIVTIGVEKLPRK